MMMIKDVAIFHMLADYALSLEIRAQKHHTTEGRLDWGDEESTGMVMVNDLNRAFLD